MGIKMNVGDRVKTKRSQKEFIVIKKEPASLADEKLFLCSDGETCVYYESDVEIVQEVAKGNWLFNKCKNIFKYLKA